MVRWHNQLNGHEFEQTPGKSKGQEAWHAAVSKKTDVCSKAPKPP